MKFDKLEEIYKPLFEHAGITGLNELFIPGFEKHAAKFFNLLSMNDNSTKKWLSPDYSWSLRKYIIKSLKDVKIHKNRYFFKMDEKIPGTPVVFSEGGIFKNIKELEEYAKRISR